MRFCDLGNALMAKGMQRINRASSALRKNLVMRWDTLVKDFNKGMPYPCRFQAQWAVVCSGTVGNQLRKARSCSLCDIKRKIQ